MADTNIRRGYTLEAQKDEDNYPVIKTEYFGQKCEVEVISPYGIYSGIPKEAEGVILNIGRNEENRVAILDTPRTRFKNLKAGELVLGNTLTRSNMKFSEDKSVTVTGANNTTITIDGSGNVTITTQGTLTLDAAGIVSINGSEIHLNGSAVGVARLNDSVSGGVITSASSTVKTA